METRASRAGPGDGQVLVLRFSAGERLAHWTHFAAFTVLLGTGLVLHWPPLKPFAGGEAGELARLVHRGAALVFLAAPLVYLMVSPREFFRSLREVLSWSRQDVVWFRNAWGYYAHGRADNLPPQGKYNSGQKLSALTQIVLYLLFACTGLLMWFGRGVVPPGVFLWSLILHNLCMIAAGSLFVLHLYLVLLHPLMRESITAMVEGTVSESFAREHHGRWLTTRVRRKHRPPA